MDYVLPAIFGLLIISMIAFRVFLPTYCSQHASTRNQLRVQEFGGYASASIFTLMAMSGDPSAWLFSAVMFVSGAWASAKRVKAA